MHVGAEQVAERGGCVRAGLPEQLSAASVNNSDKNDEMDPKDSIVTSETPSSEFSTEDLRKILIYLDLS